MKIKFLYISVILLLAYSCNKRNNVISEEIEDLGLNANPTFLIQNRNNFNLTKNLSKLTDSVFIFTDKKKILSSVSVWEFNDGFVTTQSVESFQNEVLDYSSKTEHDNYGRPIKILRYYPQMEEEQISIRSYDEYGNIITDQLFKNSVKIPTTNYKHIYEYENENVIKKTLFNVNLNSTSEEIYTYDDRGNKIQEISFDNIKTSNVYDDNNNLIETIRIDMEDNSIGAQTKYIYKDGLLFKKINGKGKNHIGGEETIYEYNENRRIIKESYSSGLTKYLDYDSFSNWTKKEFYRSNRLEGAHFRTIVYK